MRLAVCFSVVLAACASSRSTKPTELMVSGTPAVKVPSSARSDADSPVPVTSADPSWGSKTALVTLVVFSDFQCPFCARVEPVLTQVREKYGPDKVRIVWKNEPLPFHDNAAPAAEVAAGVFALGGNDAFWKMHAKLFANQRELTRDNFLRWAGESGVDAAQLKAGLDAGSWRPKVEADHVEASHAGVNGTPASFVNGVEVSGAQPLAYFQAVIDEELDKAQAKLLEGVPRAALYATVSTDNWKARPKEEEPIARAEPEPDRTVYKVPVGQSPTRGPANALVTIVVFSDFQCPFCKRFEPTLTQVMAKYPDKIRVVWKDEPLPFHDHARRAAIFAREARAQKGDVGFWAAHAKLFELSPALDKADLERAAADLKLDLKKVQAAVKADKFKAALAIDEDLADDVQASGTPHSFINGRRLVGAQSLEKVVALVDEELHKAEARVAAGTKASDLYETLMATAKDADEPEKRTVTAPSHPAPALGPASAKVTVTVFSDFQCPFCARAETTVDEIRKTYGDKVRIVARDLPLAMHPAAPLAAEAAREAFVQKGNAGYWKMRAALFKSQKELDRQHLEEHAKSVGLDLSKFRAALDGHTHKAVVDADAAAAEAAHISGTPAFVVNEYYVSGAQPFRKFRRLIDRSLAAKPAAKAPASR